MATIPTANSATCHTCHRVLSKPKPRNKVCHGCLRWRNAKSLLRRLQTLLRRSVTEGLEHCHNCHVDRLRMDRTKGRFYRDCCGCIRGRLEASYFQYRLGTVDAGKLVQVLPHACRFNPVACSGVLCRRLAAAAAGASAARSVLAHAVTD